jgi:hypothetical protein
MPATCLRLDYMLGYISDPEMGTVCSSETSADFQETKVIEPTAMRTSNPTKR